MQNMAPKWIHAGRYPTLDIIINVFICIVTIRAKFLLGCKQLVKGHTLVHSSTIRRSINFANYSSLNVFFNKILRKEKDLIKCREALLE